MVGNLVRHTAQEEPRRAAHAPITDDQEVGVLLLGDGDQRLGGVIAPRMSDGLQPSAAAARVAASTESFRHPPTPRPY